MYSHSRIQQFKDCPLSYHYKYNVGLEQIEPTEEVHHVNFGNAIHKALEAHYGGLKWDTIESTFKEHYPTQLDTTDLSKTQENGITLLKAYINRYKEEDNNWEILSIEEHDSFKYASDDEFKVKLDIIFKNKKFGGVYGLDHKTTSKGIDYKYWYQFETDSQIPKYSSYIKSKYGECSGIYINCLAFGFRQRVYKGKPAGFHYNFERQLFNRSKDQLLIEEESNKYWMSQINLLNQLSIIPTNTSHCRFCQYRSICSAGWTYPQDRELIELQYKVPQTTTNPE